MAGFVPVYDQQHIWRVEWQGNVYLIVSNEEKMD